MGFGNWLRKLFGGAPHRGGRFCPRCGFSYGWNGSRCSHCDYPKPLTRQIRTRDDGAPFAGGARCPRCGYAQQWNGRECGFCNYPGPITAVARRRLGHPQGPPVVQPPYARPPLAQPARQAAPMQVERVDLAGLDASQFAPITDAQASQMIEGFGPAWKSAYFDPLSQIPDARLPRIQVIDRAMVGLGLIAPEEVAEIHEVGAQMAAARGDLQSAAARAEAAVARTVEQQEALKAAKKAEAAERKRRHAEQVAHRRATDIVFLGRGVSAGLADRRANVERLTGAGLPVLATPADVATALGLTIGRLRWLAFHSDASPVTHYVRFTVPKKSGGLRALFAPHRGIAAAQQWVLDNILRKVPVHAAAHGFVTGRSTVSNAAGHVGRAVVVNLDLEDFFPTVTFGRVKGIFQGLGYSPAAATVLALLCTECPRREVVYDGKKLHVAAGPRALPQGACTSPALSNLVTRKLDARLAGIAAKLGFAYSRYADDMTFSAGAEAAGKVAYLLARIRHIVKDEGFSVNETKTRVQRPNVAQKVTGVVVNRRPGVPRKTVRRLRAILHRARREGLAAQNRRGHPNFRGWVEGMIAYISMVNPDQARPLREAYESLRA